MKQAKPEQHKIEVLQIGDGFRFGIGFWLSFLFMPVIIGVASLVGWMLIIIFGNI